MQPTTTIAIGSAHVRCVVTFALWRIVAVDVVGERELSDGYYDRAWREISPIYMLESDDGAAEFRLVRLAALTAAVRAVAAAQIGDVVDLPAGVEEIADALRDCVRAIDLDDELFLALGAPEREHVLKCRRAAVRVLRSFAGPLHGGDSLDELGMTLPVPTLSRASAVAS